ncbi:MAG: polyprenyl synthetase family protein [Lachnospiraceae bacterium]|nr:polyprenyl synthetase family protein [Lachnospiraceae bacterium]
MEFEQELKNKVSEAESVIKSYMPDVIDMQHTVLEAMEYTISAGGKRIRPVLMKACYDMLGGNDKLIEPFMAAIEMIHTYSLIHDDLPALDNDDYRRGRKTAHVVYGEAMAILAGDGLLNYAYETASKAFLMIDEADIDDVAGVKEEITKRKRVEKAMSILARNPGVYGMIGGQVVDVELTGQTLSKEQLEYIYNNKTGALIEAAMTIGAVLAGATDELVDKISKTAYNIGMAFQIQDDILDETATFEELGKPIHSDQDSGKVTYVTIHGMDEARDKVKSLSESAIDTINELKGDGEFLKELVKFLIHRKN